MNKLEIELVLFNLMKNSAAAMADAPSKQLDLSIDQQNNKVIFSIRDFGPQLSEAVFAHLTEPLTSMKKTALVLDYLWQRRSSNDTEVASPLRGSPTVYVLKSYCLQQPQD